MKDDPEMQDEYDMSNGTRGKFYKKDAIFSRTIRLETDLLAYYQKLADSKGTTLNALINHVLEKDRELLESVR